MSLHHAFIGSRSDSAVRFVSSIYDICMFGNGTVNETHQKLVHAKLMPSYMQAKWIHFNKFGLNRVKIENAFIMFFAKTTTLALDLALLPLTAQTGYAEIQIVPIFIDTTKFLVTSIARWQLQEYFERKFNADMFNVKNPKFLIKVKEIESFIVQKHELDFTLPDSHLEILKKFTQLPMLNYIFFYSQMTDEYVLYRSKFPNIDKIQFKNKDDAMFFFKTIFRMLRFYYYTELHALNYFFHSAFGRILDFYIDIHSLRERFLSVFYNKIEQPLFKDLSLFLSLLNQKLQINGFSRKSDPDCSEELIERFQQIYFQFFFGNENLAQRVLDFFDSKDVRKSIDDLYDDSLKSEKFYGLAKNYILSNLKSLPVSGVVTKKSSDFLSLILRTLTNVSGKHYSKEIVAIASISGVIGLVATIVGGTAVAVKNKSKIFNLLEKCYSKVYKPVTNFFQYCEKQISDIFNLDETILNSQTNRVLGSVIFIVGHMIHAPCATTISGLLAKISCFNPINAYIMRSAEKFTKERLEKIDIDVLVGVDRYLRLGYRDCGAVVVKLLNSNKQWSEYFDIDSVSGDFLIFMTHNFARVVRHQCQTMGVLFEKIANLDREIQSFQRNRYMDLFYCNRDGNGPVFLDQMCRVTASITPDMIENRSKIRFFDILIERQSILSELIHHSYYVTLYSLFMRKIKHKCHVIVEEQLKYAFKQLDFLFN